MWLLQLAVVVTFCHACGYLAQRVGQSRVIGEITAGILLGPTVFGAISPSTYHALFPADARIGVSLLADIGLALLMFEVGLHLRLPRPFSFDDVRLPCAVTLLGVALPFLLGAGVAFASGNTFVPHHAAVPFAIFCGVALSVSAVPVMARLVEDLNLSSNRGATAALTSAMLTDIVGWLLLALSISVAQAQKVDPPAFLRSTASVALCVAGWAAVLRYVVGPLLTRAARRGATQLAVIVAFSAVLMSAWTTDALGFHAAFGALVAGLALRDVEAVVGQWKSSFSNFVHLILTPVFFSCAGLQMSVALLDDAVAWFWFCAFFIAGFTGKFGGAYLAARWCGSSRNEATLIGALMNARGLMELIVLSTGLQLGVLPQKVYTILVVFALLTTSMTIPFVRVAMRPIAPHLASLESKHPSSP